MDEHTLYRKTCEATQKFFDSLKEPPFTLIQHTLDLHSLSEREEVFTWNAFATVLKKWPEMLASCCALFLYSAVNLIPKKSQLGLVGWPWRPGHHYPPWSKLLIAWRFAGMACHYCGSHADSVCIQQSTHPPAPPPPCFSDNRACRDHPFTFSASHKDAVGGSIQLKFGLIRPKHIFPRVQCPSLVFLCPITSLLLVAFL